MFVDTELMKERVRQLVYGLVDTLKKFTSKKFLRALPLLLSSLVFNTGTLILTIIVTEWASAIYIGLVLLLNLAVSFLFPFSTLETVEEKLGLTYKFPKLDQEKEAKRVNDTKFIRGIFASWTNVFLFFRPVENMSYQKISHAILLQPIRALVNIITLFILFGVTWMPPHRHTQTQQNSLIVAFCVVFAAGLVNMLQLFWYFFLGNHCCLSKSTPKDDAVEMAGMESATSTIHLDKDLEEATRDEKISLLSDMTNNVDEEDEEKGAYHKDPKDDTVELASMAKEKSGLTSTTTTPTTSTTTTPTRRLCVRH